MALFGLIPGRNTKADTTGELGGRTTPLTTEQRAQIRARGVSDEEAETIITQSVKGPKGSMPDIVIPREISKN